MACGLAEHYEGLIKQRRMDQQANYRKIYKEQKEIAAQLDMSHGDGPSPRVTKVTVPSVTTHCDEVVEYSAKLPGRLSSTNYFQQW